MWDKVMKIYMAPMEGITGYTFRNIYRQTFSDADRYFTPFISIHEKFGWKVLNEINPDNNQGIDLIPQIMVTSSDEALRLYEMLGEYGYKSININAGCPSGTVANKRRGAGLLRDPDDLDRLLYELFEKCSADISIKTRIGWSDPAEWEKLAQVYSKYPFSEVIVHARVREEYYNGKPHMEAMDIVKDLINSPIIYNGDIYTVEDAEHIMTEYPWLEGVMVGRGVFRNPGLIDELKGEAATGNDKIYEFITNLYEAYLQRFESEINTLYHMKEVWSYLGNRYPANEKELKVIRKTKKASEYKTAVSAILK